jgi:predicted CXXCH cytochrome family protein
MTVVREFYANLALNGVRDSFQKAFGVPGEGLLRRPGEPTAADRQAALGLAARKAAHVSEEIFEIRVCKTCHVVQRAEGDRGVDWTIAEVRTGHAWMPAARFDHASHAQPKCSSCHDVAKSKRSADVAMPAIEGCRECHAGAQPVARKVTSNCLLCHGFHEQEHPWDPQFRPRSAARVAQGVPGGK